MQQPENTPLTRIERQLERLEERTRDIVTRADLVELRREVVGREVLEPQLGILRTQIARNEEDRIADKKAFEKRLDDMETDQISRSDRFWAKLSPVIAAIALLIALFEFLSHFRFAP
jgi:hypothetical protein